MRSVFLYLVLLSLLACGHKSTVQPELIGGETSYVATTKLLQQSFEHNKRRLQGFHMSHDGEHYNAYETLVEIDSIISLGCDSPQWNGLTLQQQLGYWTYLNLVSKIKFEQFIEKFGGDTYALSAKRKQYYRQALGRFLFNDKFAMLNSEHLLKEKTLVQAMVLQDLTRLKLAISQLLLLSMQEPRASYFMPRLFIKANHDKKNITLHFTETRKSPEFEILSCLVNGQAAQIDTSGDAHYTTIATRPGLNLWNVEVNYRLRDYEGLARGNYEVAVKPR